MSKLNWIGNKRITKGKANIAKTNKNEKEKLGQRKPPYRAKQLEIEHLLPERIYYKGPAQGIT